MSRQKHHNVQLLYTDFYKNLINEQFFHPHFQRFSVVTFHAIHLSLKYTDDFLFHFFLIYDQHSY